MQNYMEIVGKNFHHLWFLEIVPFSYFHPFSFHIHTYSSV